MVENTSRYFTLAGFMIDADKKLKIENSVKNIKIANNLETDHEIKWHMSYSKLGLTREQYKKMRLDVFSVISQYKASVIGIVMDKESCYRNKDYIKTPKDLYAVALHILMERVCMETTKKNKKIPTVIIADSRQSINNNKLDKELKTAYSRAKNMGTYFAKFPTFCESIIFVDSDDFSGIQLADFCAGAIHKKYEQNDDEFFKELLPAIVSKKDNIYGPGIKFYK